MKTYISLWLSMALLAGVLSGCLPSGDSNLASQPTTTLPTTAQTQPGPTTVPTQPITVPSKPKSEALIYESYGILVDRVIGCDEWPLVIGSADELQKVSDLRVKGYSGEISLDLSRYDEAFFEQKTLIVVPFFSEVYPCDYVVTTFWRNINGSYSIFAKNECTRPSVDGQPCYTLMFIVVMEKIPEDASFSILEI